MGVVGEHALVCFCGGKYPHKEAHCMNQVQETFPLNITTRKALNHLVIACVTVRKQEANIGLSEKL